VAGRDTDTRVTFEFPKSGRMTLIARFLRVADDGLN